MKIKTIIKRFINHRLRRLWDLKPFLSGTVIQQRYPDIYDKSEVGTIWIKKQTNEIFINTYNVNKRCNWKKYNV